MIATLSLTDAQIAQFRQDGWLHQPGVFQGETLAQLQAEVDRLTVEAGRMVWTGPWIAGEADHGYSPLRDLPERSEPWRLACEEVLGDCALLLIGSVWRGPYNAVGIVKPPVRGQTFPLHQDGAYYGRPDGREVIANVYLDDVTAENGSLQLAPGSHTRLLYHSTELGKKQLSSEDFPVIVEPQAKAGDVVWFHVWTVHGSQPNHSQTFRRAVRANFAAGDPA